MRGRNIRSLAARSLAWAGSSRILLSAICLLLAICSAVTLPEISPRESQRLLIADHRQPRVMFSTPPDLTLHDVRQVLPLRVSRPAPLDGVAEADTDEFIICDVPADAILVIGSLDTTVLRHSIVVDAAASDPGPTDVLPAPDPNFRNAVPGEAERVSRLVASGLRTPVLPDHDHRSGVEGVRTAGMATVVEEPALPTARRFSVPRFMDSCVVHDTRQAIVVLQTPRVVVYSDRLSAADSVVSAMSLADREVCAHDRRSAALIADLLAGRVLPFVESLIGPVEDTDGDDHLSVVLTDLDQRARPDEYPVLGCVRSSDFLHPPDASSGDIVYLDRRLPEAEQLTALLTHEVSHAAVFSALLRYRNGLSPRASSMEPATSVDMPAWLNEAIAHMMERAVVPRSDNFQRRYHAFRVAPGGCPVIAPDQQLTPHLRRGGTRAAATLYLESLVSDRRQLQQLLDFRYPPLLRLERIAGIPFEQAFQRWARETAVTFLQELESSPPGTPSARLAALHRAANADESPADGWPRLCRGGSLQLRQFGTAVSFVRAAESLSTVRIRASRRARLQLSLLLPPDPMSRDRFSTTAAGFEFRSGRVSERFLGAVPLSTFARSLP